MSYAYTASSRFLKYVTIDTQSDPSSSSSPSTGKQLELSRLLEVELRELGLQDIEVSASGHVVATIPATSTKEVPVLCFCAHVDTAPDCSGTDVKPIVHKNYQGNAIVLPDDPSQVITPEEYPVLNTMLGHDIITASGLTLLGSDDKAGVAAIMDFANYLITHPEVPHGKIRVLFTTDEEVGRGTENITKEFIGAEYGYTVDGGRIGSIEDETFSADAVTVVIDGVSAHPGYAKGKLVNALKIASEIIAGLPKDTLSPESTEGREGFIHPTSIQGIAEKCTMSFIVRDFDTSQLQIKEQNLEGIVSKTVQKFPKAKYTFSVKEQYRNMKSILDHNPQVVQYAIEAIESVGLKPSRKGIRGGTDGSKLSFMGLPCANLFAAQQAIHSKHEFISIQEMERTVDMLLALAKIWYSRS
jgi:tripeptide aminopeptidase